MITSVIVRVQILLKKTTKPVSFFSGSGGKRQEGGGILVGIFLAFLGALTTTATIGEATG